MSRANSESLRRWLEGEEAAYPDQNAGNAVLSGFEPEPESFPSRPIETPFCAAPAPFGEGVKERAGVYDAETGEKLRKRAMKQVESGEARVVDPKSSKTYPLITVSRTAAELGVPEAVQAAVFAALAHGGDEQAAVEEMGFAWKEWKRVRGVCEGLASRVRAMKSKKTRQYVAALDAVARGKAVERKTRKIYKHALEYHPKGELPGVVELAKPVLMEEIVDETRKPPSVEAIKLAGRLAGHEGIIEATQRSGTLVQVAVTPGKDGAFFRDCVCDPAHEERLRELEARDREAMGAGGKTPEERFANALARRQALAAAESRNQEQEAPARPPDGAEAAPRASV